MARTTKKVAARSAPPTGAPVLWRIRSLTGRPRFRAGLVFGPEPAAGIPIAEIPEDARRAILADPFLETVIG